MKNLHLNQLEKIQAGGFWDGVCISVAAVGLAPAVGITLITGGVGGALLTFAAAGCLAYEVKNRFF